MRHSPLHPLLLLPLALVAPGCTTAASDEGVDNMVVYAILDTQAFLYGQHLIGLPVGAQDVTGDCPLGGTVHFVGATSGDGGTSVDLVLTYADCANSGTGYDVTLTGDVAFSGSFRSTGYKALATTSDSLTVVGPVQGDTEAVDVDETCALAVTDRGEDGEVSVVSGEWCGRDVYF